MSTVEDKLTASLKRRAATAGKSGSSQAAPRGKAIPERQAATQATPAAAPAKPASAGPVAAERPLHPHRVWPD